MTTASDVLDFFRRDDGLRENPPGSNCNFITQWYGAGCVPWCAETISRAFCEAGFGTVDAISVPGVTTTTRKGWAYVPFVRQSFINAGRYVGRDEGLPGDLPIFDWDGDGVGDHIGVCVTRFPDGTYLCWEGNTSGDMIRQVRRPARLINGFCRPPYDGLGNPAPAPASPPQRILKYPPVMIGDDVLAYQRRMAARGWKITCDGAFGPETRAVTLQFQKEKGLTVHGEVGEITLAVAERTDNIT